jgi:aminoglycoside 6'-N-acetyltransferase
VTDLQGAVVRLRAATKADAPDLVRIRQAPEVYARWGGGDDMVAAVEKDFAQPDTTAYVILLDDRVVGWIQWWLETDPDYRHAGIDIYVDPAAHRRGIGTDAVRTLARHLFRDHGHHRLVIDPAVDNDVAIRTYTKVGFRPVGVMRRYERGPDGTWHDNLLMDMLADELVEPSTLNSRSHDSSSSAEP